MPLHDIPVRCLHVVSGETAVPSNYCLHAAIPRRSIEHKFECNGAPTSRRWASDRDSGRREVRRSHGTVRAVL